ncbi:gliding motility-associated C-terminal domain-containing protein [Capnocytophaga sputigena]|uniref:gliding motility-associated C-terminal domain-containing protein n=1 Tax=Capnocytophaga sputigena TaxID=1019 RepID=UPI0028D667DD|nr:gliding motility-associated C-terminal domain-containing protein [Capnocytophaga sputigena]
MRRKVQIFISSLLLFFIISTAYSQNIISRLTLDSTINIATVNFEAPLVIQLKIPKEQTSVTLKVSFPEGINYSRIEVPQQEKTLVKVEKTTDSTINHPVFVVTAKPQSVVNFLVYRKFSKCVKANVNYNDIVEAMIGGKTIEKSTSVPYQFRFPKLSIVTEPIEVGKKGENRRGFSVKNLGEGAIKEFYLSVQYPDNIKNKALYYKKNGEDHLLVPESTVPKGLANKGRYFYKVNAGVLKKESVIGVSFSEIYEITNCFSSTPIQYQVYWGSDFTTEGLFETSKITEKIVSNYTVSNLLSYQEGKIRGEITDEVVYKGKITINSIDKTIQTGEKSYFKAQLPVGITPVFSLGDLKSVVLLSQNVTEYTFLLPQGKKKNDSFDYTLKLQTNKKLTFVPSSKMVYYTTEESGRKTCTATPLYTSIKKEITIPIEETLLHPIKLQTTDDTFSHTTTTQTIVLGNILTNDSYNTQSVTTASVTISTTTALTNAPYIATATGEVFLPVHTPAGTYTLTYNLCAKSAPYNCSEVATVTIIVSPSPIKLQTTDNTFSHTTTTQTIVLGNILTNDSYNTQSVTTASVTISTTTALTNAPYIATATGEVFLPVHTPAGTYTLTYNLCAKSAPYNCSEVATVTIIVNPSPIKLQTTDDTFSHTTTTQMIVLGNILTNDSYNTQSVTTASVTISTTTTSINVPYIAIATGEVFLPAHTPAGTYTLTYTLCAKSAPYNCSGVATVTIIVNLSPIKLQTTDDTFSHTTTTQTIVLGNILTNDNYNSQSVTTVSVTISTTTALINVPYIATVTGEVFLPANTLVGTYTLTYSLCAKSAPYNCSEVATVTIIVSPSPIKLQTTNDTFSHTTTTQTIVLGNVLANDSYNTQSVTTASVTISTTTALTNVPYIAIATGEVFLPAHTLAGTYTLTYSLCAKTPPYNCSGVATVTIIVSPSPIKLQTTDDTFSHTTTTQTIVLGNILNNDSYNTQSVTTASVTISTTTALTNVPYIATVTGEVFLPAHTPAGTYTLTYSLCTKTPPYNCSGVATVTVIVSPSPIKLQTTDDTFSHTTTTQMIVLGNVLANDSYNTQSVTTASVTISTTTALTNVPYIAIATGEVFLPVHTPAGTYTLTYSLCAKTVPYNCSGVATVTIIVSPPLVIARDDTYTVTIGTTTITESIYSNDSIGEQTPNASLVNFQSIGGSKDSDNFYVLSVNLAGNVLIPQGTPIGTYTLQYRICDVKDSHNCATATITVMVTEIPTPLIIARDDTYTVTIGTTTITESIYSNDSIGEQIPNTSLVNFQSIGGSKDSDNFYVLSVNLAGNVLIPQGTPIGTYTLEYRICDIHHQSNCDTAIVKVSITSPPVPPSTLVVTPDKFTYTGNAIVGNILDNDTIDDNPIELPNDDVNIEAEEPTDTAPYIETSTGNVIVPTHTPAGTYTLNYELCIENLTICDATTVEVIVPANSTPPAPPKPQEDETATPTNVLIPYNAISLNDDNKNDYFLIEGIEKYPDNIVRIYNKEGLKVFEVTGYDNKNQSFKGFTEGEVAVKKSLELPVGTYFYFIEYTDENHQLQRKKGWLYLKK